MADQAAMDPPANIPSTKQALGCYSGLYSADAHVCEPANVEDLKRVFAEAGKQGFKVTFRSGGHSFDGQALGNDVVVSMTKFDSIQVLDDPKEPKVRVGPGATWGAILAKLKPHGLVPAVMVTTENATAGGTLSGDCLSRFSPAYGKEGESIESFKLLTTDGKELVCTPPGRDVPRASWTKKERVFCGVIGGLGYLGAVVEITYRVLRAGEPDQELRVRTIVRKFATFKELAADLVPETKGMIEQDSDPKNPKKLDAIWSALDTRGDGTQSALFFTSAYTTETKGKRMPLHRPKLLLRILVEWLMRVPFISKLLWRIYFRFLFDDREEFIDHVDGFTFFMDGNARAKRIGKCLGFSMKNIQQTFVVPRDPQAEESWDQAQDDLVKWLEHAHKFLLDRGLTPTLNDALYLPRDRPFLLSASADMPGFAVSYAFETSNPLTLYAAQQAFIELADYLWDEFQGRVYLVKNVFAKPKTLAAMYGSHVAEFRSLQNELDPGKILGNDFRKRTVGSLS
jgi:decaprenylphospho-beta-D-ribofuranose 2-oxidase